MCCTLGHNLWNVARKGCVKTIVVTSKKNIFPKVVERKNHVLLYFGGFLSSVVLQGLIEVAVGAGTFAFAHIKYGMNKCLEALLWGQGVASEWQVVCHSGGVGRRKKRNLIFYML